MRPRVCPLCQRANTRTLYVREVRYTADAGWKPVGWKAVGWVCTDSQCTRGLLDAKALGAVLEREAELAEATKRAEDERLERWGRAYIKHLDP